MSLVRTLSFIINHPLNKKARALAVLRFLKWQVASRLVQGPIVYKWIGNAKILACAGETGVTGNIYTGLHEFPDMGFLLHVLRPEDFFVDVGANVGAYTVLAGAVIGCHSLSMEPVPETYTKLVANIRINDLDQKVQCVNKGAGAIAGTLSFTRSKDTMNHVVYGATNTGDDTVAVDVITLDELLMNAQPFLIKIDVEGYETAVLEGAYTTLRQPSLKAIIMELNGSGERYGFDEQKIVDIMSAHDFQGYSYNPLQRKLIPLLGKNFESGNTIFIRNVDFIVDRLKNAQSIAVNGAIF